ncbi:carotenoid biosynthesis protein [Cytophagaceae bacterium YF14B1]|uniref:Carotenoid biosynthesis protein n=1 Tax=Xanthocytophaga flava TaxID=3048013 RepID=A0AAE3QQJ0_9BACT|nr:carotenoid biosynthesis protein [Xanthocytophaga flavus]MDJ1481375.1 carotenoid biosynthesis protein [Xanthocytophaga flavus]
MMHLAGIIGLNWQLVQPLFTILVPFNLLATTLLLLLFQPVFSTSFYIFCLICFITGYLVELAGIKTGIIFGNYEYGSTLGWKIAGVPVIIGCNWLTLIYCTGVIAHTYLRTSWLRPIFASLLMVLIDYFIEPVAMYLDFWSWQDNIVPFHNYLGWFITSFFLQLVFSALVPVRQNSMALPVYLIQFAFFLSCNLLYYFL